MRLNRTTYVIAASTLALIALLVFQVKWLSDSHNLIQEQFDEKVHLALCYAAGSMMVESPSTCAASEDTCVPLSQEGSDFKMTSTTPFQTSSLDSLLEVAFDIYAIDMDYKWKIIQNENVKKNQYPTYQCSLNSTEKSDNYVMSLTFPERRNYVFGKMKFMFISSLVILFFVTSVFIFANYTMLRQKRMAKISKEFFNNMAHEFRTPLTNISLAGNLLTKKNENPTHLKYINIVKGESKKLHQQVERVLHLANLENGKYQMEKESICPKTLIEDVIEEMDIQIKEKNAKVIFEPNQETIQLQGDRFHLGNAFRNLLDNALKYSCASPEINIRLKNEKEGVMIQFEDNGIGISKKNQTGVFEKYQRVDTGNVHNQKGFGIGLAYVKMIVERHQGVIKIISDLNKGTRFDLFLPSKN